MRLLPSSVLPNKYPFLEKHSFRSMLIAHTIDINPPLTESSYPEHDRSNIRLHAPHGFYGVPLCDVWFAYAPNLTNNPKKDIPNNFAKIYQLPHLRDNRGLEEAVFWSDNTNVYIDLNFNMFTNIDTEFTAWSTEWINADLQPGSWHLYFHVKVYAGEFYNKLIEGNLTIEEE